MIHLPPNDSVLWPFLRMIILLIALYVFSSHFDSTEVKTLLLVLAGDGALSKVFQSRAPGPPPTT